MNEFASASSRSGHQLLELTNLIRAVALKNPHDEEAQIRARAAIEFYRGVPGFPQLTEPESPASNDDFISKDIDRLSELPIEISHLIFSHISEFEYEARQSTLVALSATCRKHRAFAEAQLYARPRDLETIERQWKFRFALAVEPRRGEHVKSLQVLWLSEGENTQLLIDIARVCPNVEELLVQRGQSSQDSNTILEQDVLGMAALFDASPSLTDFTYNSFCQWTHQYQDEEASFSWSLRDPRFGKAAKRLVRLAVHGLYRWILDALWPHLSDRLLSLTMGADTPVGHESSLLREISRRTPSLEELEIRALIATPWDLEDACQTWGPRLKVLRIWNGDDFMDQSNWIQEAAPSLMNLEELLLGPSCFTGVNDVGAIVRSLKPQRLLSLTVRWLEDYLSYQDQDGAKTKMEDILVKMINSHSSTLQRISFASDRPVAGRRVLEACKKATRLECLDVAPGEDVTGPDLDYLLEACPRLWDISDALQAISSCRGRWEERLATHIRIEEEKWRRDCTTKCLGMEEYLS